MLMEELLKPLGIPQTAFAERLGVSYHRLNELIHGKRGVTPDTALRLARVLGMSAEFWLGLQQDWDLWHAKRSPEAKRIEKLEPISAWRRRGAGPTAENVSRRFSSLSCLRLRPSATFHGSSSARPDPSLRSG
jgi:addiction module HigA family antidote